jgi:hypothetical protein
MIRLLVPSVNERLGSAQANVTASWVATSRDGLHARTIVRHCLPAQWSGPDRSAHT